MTARDGLTVRAVAGLPRLAAGTDLAALLVGTHPGLADGDVLTVSSKAVAKVEGRVVRGTRDEVVARETDRVVAHRAALRIVRTRHGLVLAAAGVDESNTDAGTVVPLPVDPDASARRLREAITDRTGRNVAVLVTDTAGRAWRTGQTDIAVGCAGLAPLVDLAGTRDAWGRELSVTAPAVADEVAGAAELVLAKAGGTPMAVLSGLAEQVLPVGEHGPGAAVLIRPEHEDLFGLGSRDAVLAAVRRSAADVRGFTTAGPGVHASRRLEELGALAAAAHPAVEVELTGPEDEPVAVVRPVSGRALADADVLRAAGAVAERLRMLAWADRIPLREVEPPPGTVLALTAGRRP